MPTYLKAGKEAELKRRYLAINYGEDKIEEKKELTESEWMEKERKEIADVSIRFANYTTLVR
jgi:hypothetical protein